MTPSPPCDRHGDTGCPCRLPIDAALVRPHGDAAPLRFVVETMEGPPAEGDCVDPCGTDGRR